MKQFIVCIIFFVAGYFIRGWTDRQGIVINPQTVLAPVGIGTKTSNTQSEFITEVQYENGSFRPASVVIKTGNYLIITNKSESPMWLVSEFPQLNTPRGYGKSEQLKIKPIVAGTYKVGNKLNLGAMLTVIVSK